MFVETLENRTLLSAVLGADGVLTVTGTDTANGINIGLDRDGKLVVAELTRPATPPPGNYRPQPTITKFTAADVHSIVVNAGAGHDRVEIGPRLDVNALINGGDGNDQLAGGAGDDTINGGNGRDQIVGGRGADQLNGDAGNDWINAADRGGIDTVNGGDNDDPAVNARNGDYALVDAADIVTNVEHLRTHQPPHAREGGSAVSRAGLVTA